MTKEKVATRRTATQSFLYIIKPMWMLYAIMCRFAYVSISKILSQMMKKRHRAMAKTKLENEVDSFILSSRAAAPGLGYFIVSEKSLFRYQTFCL